MKELAVISGVLNSILIATGDLLLFSILFRGFRIRHPGLRAAGLLFSILHSWLALFLISPFCLFVVRIQHDEFILLPPWLQQLDSWALGAWLCPAAALLGVWIWRTRRACRALTALAEIASEQTIPLVDHVQTLAARMKVPVPELLLLQGVHPTPFITGFSKPRLVFPLSLLSYLEPHELQAVLAHELAHVRGQDTLLQTVLEAANRLLFFNPAHAWLIRKLREEIEKLRDLQACRVTGGRHSLATALVKVAQRSGRVPPEPILAGSAGLVFSSPRGLTEKRMIQLANPPARGRLLLLQGLLLALALFAQSGLAPSRNAFSVLRRERGESGRDAIYHGTLYYGIQFPAPGWFWRPLEEFSDR